MSSNTHSTADAVVIPFPRRADPAPALPPATDDTVAWDPGRGVFLFDARRQGALLGQTMAQEARALNGRILATFFWGVFYGAAVVAGVMTGRAHGQ